MHLSLKAWRTASSVGHTVSQRPASTALEKVSLLCRGCVPPLAARHLYSNICILSPRHASPLTRHAREREAIVHGLLSLALAMGMALASSCCSSLGRTVPTVPAAPAPPHPRCSATRARAIAAGHSPHSRHSATMRRTVVRLSASSDLEHPRLGGQAAARSGDCLGRLWAGPRATPERRRSLRLVFGLAALGSWLRARAP